MTTLPKGPTNNILMNVQGIFDPIGYTLRMRKRYGDPMSLPKMDGKPVLATGSVEGLRAVFAVPPEALDQMLAESFTAVFGESSLFVLSGARHTAMRKLLMPPFHGQRMRLYGKQICDLALQHSRDFKPGLQLVAQDLMHTISLQTIIHLVFGVTAPAEAARLEKLLEALRKSFSLGLTFTLMIPRLRRELWGFGPWARRLRATQDLRSFLDPEIARLAGRSRRVRADHLGPPRSRGVSGAGGVSSRAIPGANLFPLRIPAVWRRESALHRGRLCAVRDEADPGHAAAALQLRARVQEAGAGGAAGSARLSGARDRPLIPAAANSTELRQRPSPSASSTVIERWEDRHWPRRSGRGPRRR
jgi:hypothetical protein